MHQNINYIKKKFGNCSDLVYRKINNINYVYLESLSSDDKISNFLNKSIMYNENINVLIEKLESKVFNSHIIKLNKIEDAFYYLMSGYTCVFMENEKSYLAVETKGNLDRSITESTTEPIIRGPKDSFTENFSTNIGLIRKRIKDINLRVDETKIGVRTKSKIGVIYLNDVVDKKLLLKIKKTLNQIIIDGIIDSGYVRDYLEKDSKTSFPTIITTERPDLTCQNILDGKIIVLVENSPIVLILPANLSEFLKVSEDYYQKTVNASITRLLRFTAFIITIITPALYIALMTFNQEMIPDQLLISLAAQRSQVPYPTFIEIIIYTVIFEILRQADIRSPNIAGASMSIVGALILGDAAVNAGLVSPMVIIVVALTSICELVFSNLDLTNAIRQWRMLFIFSTVVTGLIGLVMGAIIFITKLASIEVNEVPYLIPLSPLNKNLFRDGIVLKPANKRIFRQDYITNNTIRGIEK